MCCQEDQKAFSLWINQHSLLSIKVKKQLPVTFSSLIISTFYFLSKIMITIIFKVMTTDLILVPDKFL